MMSLANLPILGVTTSPTLASYTERPAEREVDRDILAAISPDREMLFVSGGKSIDEIRQHLKVRAGPELTLSNWLYQVKCRANIDSRDATSRTSTLTYRVKQMNDENELIVDASATNAGAVRRVYSTVSLNRARPTTAPVLRIDHAIPIEREGGGPTVWGSFVLSTPHKLISPRPLGPTHILILHEEPLSMTKSGKNVFPRAGRGFANHEAPVNDLVLLMNAPNLIASTLPHRLHSELPRVLLHVPNLQTIHPVIVFLHTLNQAELFRALVPEWIRDVMYPLPLPPVPTTTPAAAFKTADAASIISSKKARSIFSLRTSRSSASSMHSVDGDTPAAPPPPSSAAIAAWMAAQDIRAREIVASLPFFADESPAVDELVSTSAALQALGANLSFLGFAGRAVWNELEASLGILTRAIVHRAAPTDDELRS